MRNKNVVILKIAEARRCAIGSFRNTSMTGLNAVIGDAKEKNESVIIMHTQVHEEMELLKIDEIASRYVASAEV